MKDLTQGFDSGRAKLVTDYLSARISTYFGSDCYKKLKARYERMRDSIDQKYPVNTENNFKSKIAFSLTRQRYLNRRANLKFNFRNDPLFTVSAMGSTEHQNAMNMQEILRLSLKHTKFRPTSFESIIDFSSRYGCAVSYTQFQEINKRGMKTIYAPEANAATPYSRIDAASQAGVAVKNYFIHPLNYFQDPSAVDPEESSYRGFIDTWRVSDLISCVIAEPQNYIAENIEKVVKEVQKDGLQDEKKYSDYAAGKDDSHLTVDVRRIWATVNIRGNEDDDTIYYAEIVGDTVIRFQDNPLDGNIIPLQCFRIRRRPEFWWGNTDAEDVLSHENFYNLMMSLKADFALRSTDQLIFYPRAFGVSDEDLRNRHAFGGFIPYDTKVGQGNIKDQLYAFQPQDNSTNTIDWVMREMKESVQNLSTRPDLSRGYNQGGYGNKTATAASILASQGDILDSDLCEVFSYDLIGMGDKNMILLQQYLGEKVALRGNSKTPVKTLEKHQFLGDFGLEIESSLQKNDLTELARFQNAIIQLQGFAQTPAGPLINWEEIMREMVSKMNIGDVDKIINQPQPPAPPLNAEQLPPGMGSAGISTIQPGMEGTQTGAIT